jgi:hypothetical protein
MRSVSRALAALCVTIIAVAASPVRAGQAPPPERYFGVVGRPCAVPDTTPDSGYSSYVAHPLPPAAQDQALVRAFTRASARNNRDGLRRTSSSTWLGSPVAESCISAIRALSAACRPEPLYLLGDGEIRQSWRCGSKVPYTLFFTIADGRVSNVWAMEEPPAVVSEPG